MSRGPQILVTRQALLREDLEKLLKEMFDIAGATFQLGTINKDIVMVAASKHMRDDCQLLLTTLKNYFKIIETKL